MYLKVIEKWERNGQVFWIIQLINILQFSFIYIHEKAVELKVMHQNLANTMASRKKFTGQQRITGYNLCSVCK